MTTNSIAVRPSVAKEALDELEKASLYLFQIRKYGLILPIPDHLRSAMADVDKNRSEKVLALIDGAVQL